MTTPVHTLSSKLHKTPIVNWDLNHEEPCVIVHSNTTVPFELSQTKDFQRPLWANKSPRAFYPLKHKLAAILNSLQTMFTLRLFTQNGSFHARSTLNNFTILPYHFMIPNSNCVRIETITLVLGFVSRQPSPQAKTLWLGLICLQSPLHALNPKLCGRQHCYRVLYCPQKYPLTFVLQKHVVVINISRSCHEQSLFSCSCSCWNHGKLTFISGKCQS